MYLDNLKFVQILEKGDPRMCSHRVRKNSSFSTSHHAPSERAQRDWIPSSYTSSNKGVGQTGFGLSTVKHY